MGQAVSSFEVRGLLDGQPVSLKIVDRDSRLANLTVRELWPNVKIQSVKIEDQWS